MLVEFNGFEISPVHSGDAWKICDLVVTNEDRLKRFFPKTLEENLTPTLSRLFVERKIKAYEEGKEFLFTLKHSETRHLAGLINLKNLDWDSLRGEFAYCIDHKFSGQNLASKAIEILTCYAFNTLNLKTLIIITHKKNLPSVRVATSNGFVQTKTLKNAFNPPGEHAVDMEFYELNKSHYRNMT